MNFETRGIRFTKSHFTPPEPMPPAHRPPEVEEPKTLCTIERWRDSQWRYTNADNSDIRRTFARYGFVPGLRRTA